MAGVTSPPPKGPPPLTGYIESPPGSGHWIQDPSLGGGSPGGGSIPGGGGGGGGGTIINPPVPAPPIADFTYIVYASGLVTFRSASQGVISSYYWYFGDNKYSTSPSVIHQYTASGTFPVTLRVSNSGGTSEKTLNVDVTVAIPEVVDFTFVTGALGVQFTDTSTKAGDRNWNFGDNTISVETSPYHLYDTPGIYTVILSIGGVQKSYKVSVDYGIVLEWQDNSSNEDGFKIERSPDGVASWALIATVGAGITTLTVTENLHGVDPAVENHFRVYAYNGAGDSGYTNVVETLCGG